MNYKFLKILGLPNAIFTYFYSKYSEIEHLTYEEHKNLLLDQCYGLFDYYEKNMRQLGQESETIIYSDNRLQNKWIKEQGIKNDSSFDILLAQLKRISPTVVFLNHYFSSEQIIAIRKSNPSIKLLIGWCGAPLTENQLKPLTLCDYTIICSQLFQPELNKYGIKIWEINHGFETTILNKIVQNESKYDISFVGSIIAGTGFHNYRLKVLENIMQEDDIKLIFSGSISNPSVLKVKSYPFIRKYCEMYINHSTRIFPSLIEGKINKIVLYPPPTRIHLSKKLRSFVQPPLFGLEMFQMVADSKISLNVHGDIAANHAANMRLFEATGLGSCLITDYKNNISDFFKPDEEIVTYKSPEECVEKIHYLMEHPDIAKSIALKGQEKCLTKHSGLCRTEKLDAFIQKALSN